MSIDFNDIVNQHAAAQLAVSTPTMTKAVTPDSHRGWTITWDYGQFQAVGPNYDASYEGPEDGWVDNGHRVFARTREDLIVEIDAWFEENEAPAECAQSPFGRHQVDTSMESGPNNCFYCEAPMDAAIAKAEGR